jgi:hypothetical protein
VVINDKNITEDDALVQRRQVELRNGRISNSSGGQSEWRHEAACILKDIRAHSGSRTSSLQRGKEHEVRASRERVLQQRRNLLVVHLARASSGGRSGGTASVPGLDLSPNVASSSGDAGGDVRPRAHVARLLLRPHELHTLQESLEARGNVVEGKSSTRHPTRRLTCEVRVDHSEARVRQHVGRKNCETRLLKSTGGTRVTGNQQKKVLCEDLRVPRLHLHVPESQRPATTAQPAPGPEAHLVHQNS